ncbi:MAG: LysR family transcriptional regulator [Bauldia sp.]
MQNATIKQLRSVVEIVRTGRIVSAARELRLTTPAITSQIKLLEEELGVGLFDRTRDGMRPTAAGMAVYSTAMRVLAQLDECADAIRDLKGLKGGTVAVGVVSTGKYFAPYIITAFLRTHPGIDIRMTIGNRGEIIERLRDYAVEFAIMGQPPADFAVQSTRIGEHPLIIIAPPDHHLARRRRVAKADLIGERFLLREKGSGTRANFEAAFADADVPVQTIEFGSNETIKQGVMAGLGIAPISGHTVAAELTDGRLVALDVEGFPVRRQWYVVHRSDRTLSPSAASFLDFLVSRGADFLPPPHLFDRGLGRNGL